MKSRTVLVQWIGHSDLRAMAATLPDAKRKQVLDRIRGEASDSMDKGPTKTLLNTQQFDEVRFAEQLSAGLESVVSEMARCEVGDRHSRRIAQADGLRGDQLRRGVADSLGIRTLRPCQRGLHRSRS